MKNLPSRHLYPLSRAAPTVAAVELERAKRALADAAQRLGSEPDAAVESAIDAVRRATAVAARWLRGKRVGELALKLASLERALRASKARLRIAAPGAEREQALKDLKADLEEALALVEQLEREASGGAAPPTSQRAPKL